MPEPKMRDAFRSELRERLMAEAVTALAPRPHGTPWTMLRPAMGVGLAAVLLVGGAGSAAANSVPGEAAFPLKRAFEDLQLNLTLDDVQRVELLSQLADRRLADLQQVADRADESKAPAASEEFAAALARFRVAVDALQQAAPADKSSKVQDLVDAARGKHEAVLDEVQQKLDNEDARNAIERARDQEDEDTTSDKSKKGSGAETPRPARTPTPARTPRPTERAAETARATRAPLATQRTDNPRGTPRPTENADGGD
ncbi:MAG: DUF5667 domain-containing protein [Chloroflexota bacterium]|nr:DUF5667 domain-containing protein [Chloroflexota bacterium]